MKRKRKEGGEEAIKIILMIKGKNKKKWRDEYVQRGKLRKDKKGNDKNGQKEKRKKKNNS